MRSAHAADPAAKSARPNSRVNGVHIGLNVPYSFGNNAMDADTVLQNCVALGVSALELRAQPVEGFLGVPAELVSMRRTATGGDSARSKNGPADPAAAKASAARLDEWRRSVPMSRVAEFRKKYEDAGVFIEILKVDGVFKMSEPSLDYHFAMAKALGNPFFNAVEKGGQQAAAELTGVTVNFTAPQTSSAEGQIEVLNALIAQKVDAIAISATDPDAVVPTLKKAMERGIKVVSYDSAVAKDGRSIAICGYSGAGKSTLAAALCGDGCSFVADDICVVGLDGRQRPMILPDGRHLKLWKESIDHLGLAERRGRAVRESFAKYYVDPPDPHAQPSPLSAVYVLREARPSLKEGVERLSLPDAMRTLDHEAYRPRFRAKLQPRPQTMAHVAAVLSRAKVFRLVRPRGFEHLQDTVAAVQAHWDSLG